MLEYEIRIIQPNGAPLLISPEIHLSDNSAIKSARKMAHDRPFEVWRGLECIASTRKPVPPVAAWAGIGGDKCEGHYPGKEAPPTL